MKLKKTESRLAQPTADFNSLGITPKLLHVINQAGFSVPTPIQAQAIPTGIAGNDLVGIAQTGTGKTMAFGIPMIQRIGKTKTTGLVILPTRELALQVNESLQKIGKPLGLKTAVLIGGEAMSRQLYQLRRGCHIIIATPGRLIDHLDQRTIKLDRVGILVLDEADRMLDMGFAPQINQILKSVPTDRQTMLFSATMPAPIMAIANKAMKTPVRIEVAAPGTTADQVAQELIIVKKHDKQALLEKLLENNKETVLVFSRTKFGAKRIASQLTKQKIPAAEIHSNRSLNQRLEALAGFKSGKYQVLVATDIAARGIDVTGIGLVINFDLPDNPDDYVHRIGRTGRAGRSGKAVSFATPEQSYDVKSIERLIKQKLPLIETPELPPARPAPRYSSMQDQRGVSTPRRVSTMSFPKSRNKYPGASKNNRFSDKPSPYREDNSSVSKYSKTKPSSKKFAPKYNQPKPLPTISRKPNVSKKPLYMTRSKPIDPDLAY